MRRLRAGLEHHNRTCPVPARAFLLHPVDHGLLGFDELWGVPVLPDDRVAVKHVHLDCEASAWRVEDELAELRFDTRERS